jgi:Family of unknown function (DUF6493)
MVQVTRTAGKETEGLKKFFSAILPKAKEPAPLLYDYLVIKAQWVYMEHDVQRVLLLTPNNPGCFLAEVVSRCMKYPIFWGEEEKRSTRASMQVLHEIWNNPGDMAYLFLGGCMLSSDKTIANIAGETWLRAVSSGKMDNEKLGHTIGTIQKNEYAPLKRLTDLLGQNLLRVSALHNRHLQVLVEGILAKLPDTPVKNLKALLEVYVELLAANNTTPANTIISQRLHAWAQNSGLQKLVKKLTG